MDRIRRLPLLVNEFERAVDRELVAVCATFGMRLALKVGVREVVDCSSIADRGDRDYAFKAHFDFLVVDGDDQAVLAVEFDGPAHREDAKQIARDRRKDRICQQARLPLIRAGANSLQPADHRSLLHWLLTVVLEGDRLGRQRKAWEASDGETDPPDVEPEAFTYGFEVSFTGEDMPPLRPYDCFAEARQEISRFLVGRLDLQEPVFWHGLDIASGATRGVVGLQVRADGADSRSWLVGSAKARLDGLRGVPGGLASPIVAQDLAVLDLSRQMSFWQRHDTVSLLTRPEVQTRVAGLTAQALTGFGVLSDAEHKLILNQRYGIPFSVLTKEEPW